MPTVCTLRHSCQLQSVIITETLEQTVSAGTWKGADDNMQTLSRNSNTKTRKELTNNNTSNTDINTCKNCGRTGHWVKDCSRPGGRADNNSNNNDNNHNNNKNKGKNNRKGKGKGKQLELLQTLPLSETASTATLPIADIEDDRSCLVQSRHTAKRMDHDPGRSDNEFTVSNSETSWCRRLAS